MPFATSPDGTRIHYELAGSGPALMLQHGTGGSLEMWKARGFAERLRDRFQLVLVDSRGHGKSDKPDAQPAYALPHRAADLVAILDHAGIDRAHYWGYSMGGWIGYGMLQHQPGRFDSAILGGFGPVPDPYFGRNPADLARGSVERREVDDPTEYERLRAIFSETASFQDVQDVVRAIQMPLLLYSGTEDPRYDSVKAAAELTPHASFFELPGLDHGEGGGAVDEVVPRVLEFLATVPAAK
jgi:pimeloyl-ACP methyl ester carboxylesterase